MTPTDPNSSLVANFDPAHRRIAPLYPITRARPIEEMEEKEKYVNQSQISKTTLEQCFINSILATNAATWHSLRNAR
jgi:hypothetical protein